MRKDHRPRWLKKSQLCFRRWRTRRFLLPQFDAVGREPEVMHPASVQVFGGNIRLGDYPHLISTPDNCIRLTTFGHRGGEAWITIGDFVLISPGVRISAAESITIGNACMIAANVYISDSDWHGLYNRTRPFRCTAPVRLGDNVWVGDSAIVCKGVSIGDNSVVGAGSVVTRDVPANTVVAGNPAREIKRIEPGRRMITREALFADAFRQAHNLDELDKMLLEGNSLWGWLRSLLFPRRGD
ncbi:acyltransferase [Microbulbifer rhizosphaerae]|uniref:Acetyltransferase-like isoleucine patch superfamily enzyme n=1 Tax=Microbulbifer rhizosphaerae TaxID=1562603 RepID=A0A7W4WAZ0_9GAMM|nr:acyltransferase [Microbulbifer rhizosphaerae]MBB3060368.1 acetyltransferase-like isoleucine patch superfamily enzyme [Microbulbifer rhizosphaerae]